jgi:uncharacterized RDD family membrane protein YckC
MRQRVPEPNLVGHYAGPVTRLAAFAGDCALLTALFSLGVAATLWVVQLMTRGEVEVSDLGPWLSAALFVGWAFVYFWATTAVGGRTPGKALLGLQIVRRDGASLNGRRAALRVLALPLELLTLGIGTLGIVFGREHRALHDVVADTAVVYAWDARAARLRFLAAGGHD